jgi:hypothetical protein
MRTIAAGVMLSRRSTTSAGLTAPSSRTSVAISRSSRNSEIPTQIWYSAYPHLSIKNVNNNTRIRNLLPQDLPEKEAADLLKLI